MLALGPYCCSSLLTFVLHSCLLLALFSLCYQHHHLYHYYNFFGGMTEEEMFFKLFVCLGNVKERDAQLLGDLEAMMLSRQHW